MIQNIITLLNFLIKLGAWEPANRRARRTPVVKDLLEVVKSISWLASNGSTIDNITRLLSDAPQYERAFNGEFSTLIRNLVTVIQWRSGNQDKWVEVRDGGTLYFWRSIIRQELMQWYDWNDSGFKPTATLDAELEDVIRSDYVAEKFVRVVMASAKNIQPIAPTDREQVEDLRNVLLALAELHKNE